KKLCNAWADGINYYVFKHAELDNPIGVYEPWFPFLWTDGSIGAINTAGIGARELKDLYGTGLETAGESSNSSNASNSLLKDVDDEMIPELGLTGSNGFAFSPKITASKNA